MTRPWLLFLMHTQNDLEKAITHHIRSLHLPEFNTIPAESFAYIRAHTIQKEDERSVTLVRVPEDLLSAIHINFTKIISKLKEVLPDSTIMIIRNNEIKAVPHNMRPAKKVSHRNMKRYVHEQWIKDLCYPALVEMRMTDIMADGDGIETVLVSNNDMFDEKDFNVMSNVFTFLTGKRIRYGNMFY